MTALLDHAARVLDHEPSRTMAADALHRRTTRETGVDVSYARFIQSVGDAPARFALIPPDPLLGTIEHWDLRQRTLYESALDAAGVTRPLVVLAERPCDSDPLSDGPAEPAVTTDVLLDVHDTLTYLIRSSEPGEPMQAALAAAMDELHAVRRLLSS